MLRHSLMRVKLLYSCQKKVPVHLNNRREEDSFRPDIQLVRMSKNKLRLILNTISEALEDIRLMKLIVGEQSLTCTRHNVRLSNPQQ
jgi:hypothetical protein